MILSTVLSISEDAIINSSSRFLVEVCEAGVDRFYRALRVYPDDVDIEARHAESRTLITFSVDADKIPMTIP